LTILRFCSTDQPFFIFTITTGMMTPWYPKKIGWGSI
jgi:hypothetical protein